jgi:GH25 family lysozyme M1 (1,4-beta-N-acetylmuramidase)
LNFAQIPLSKKAGNARWKLLAYRSFSCVQTTQNGKLIIEQFPMIQKTHAVA